VNGFYYPQFQVGTSFIVTQPAAVLLDNWSEPLDYLGHGFFVATLCPDN
jgi:hypothetical protein